MVSRSANICMASQSKRLCKPDGLLIRPGKSIQLLFTKRNAITNLKHFYLLNEKISQKIIVKYEGVISAYFSKRGQNRG